MALEVRWTDEAEVTFDVIVTFIDEGWGELAANKFLNKAKRILISISQQPLLYPESAIGNVHKAVITKQTSLFYEVYDNRIILLFFWDNRQDPLFY